MAKWLTRWSAKPVFEGSIPSRCSNKSITYSNNHLSRICRCRGYCRGDFRHTIYRGARSVQLPKQLSCIEPTCSRRSKDPVRSCQSSFGSRSCTDYLLTKSGTTISQPPTIRMNDTCSSWVFCMEFDYSSGEFAGCLDQIKLSTFGTKEVALHRREIINKRPFPFTALADPAIRDQFDSSILELFRTDRYTASGY
jgi:hypothetical protein